MAMKPLAAELPPAKAKEPDPVVPTQEAPANSNGTTPTADPASDTSAPADALTGEPVPPEPAPIAIPNAPIDNSPLDTTPSMTADVPKVQLPDGSWVPAPNPGPTAEQLANNPSDLKNMPSPAEKVAADVADAKAWVAAGEPADWPKVEGGAQAGAGLPTPPPSTPAIIEAGPNDIRALWDCVTPQGPRTGCRPFRSDDHLLGLRIVCPTCRNTVVLRIEE